MAEPLVLAIVPDPDPDPPVAADVATPAGVDVDVTDFDLVTKTRSEWEAEREQIANAQFARARKTFAAKQEKRAKQTADEDAERAAMLARVEQMELLVEMALTVAHKPAAPEPPKPAPKPGLLQMSPQELRELGPDGIRERLVAAWTKR